MASASHMHTDARVVREAQTLARAGYDVTVLALASDPPAAIDGVRLVEVGCHTKRPTPGDLARLSARFVASQADVYHVHNVHLLPAGWLAARLRRARVVYESHELFTAMTP